MTTQQQPPSTQNFEVNLPAGGKLVLQTQDEVDMWDESSKKYQSDYRLTKSNDLVLLGAILTQNLALFRAQQRLNGMEPEFDKAGIPTGRYKKSSITAKDTSAAQTSIIKASEEIRNIEKALGIDKKSREAGGAFTVADYIATAKKAAHQFGIHVAKRNKAYEEFVMELRWKVRLLRNGDAEDLQHHNLNPDSILSWAEDEMVKLEAIDKQFAKEKGKVFIGQL